MLLTCPDTANPSASNDVASQTCKQTWKAAMDVEPCFAANEAAKVTHDVAAVTLINSRNPDSKYINTSHTFENSILHETREEGETQMGWVSSCLKLIRLKRYYQETLNIGLITKYIYWFQPWKSLSFKKWEWNLLSRLSKQIYDGLEERQCCWIMDCIDWHFMLLTIFKKLTKSHIFNTRR